MARVQLAMITAGWLVALTTAVRTRLRRRHDRRWLTAMETLGALPRQRQPEALERQASV